MSEVNAQGDAEESSVTFEVKKVYTKDLSLETPNSPAVFTQEWDPDVNVQLHTGASQLDEQFFEVVLTVTVTAKIAENTAYLVEVHQGGIFQIVGLPDEEMGPVLGSVCPGILFPYAREVVGDLVQRGGFQQMVLTPVNFDALYYQHVMENAKAAEEAEST
jgi:preprotein translocase subunit SecB